MHTAHTCPSEWRAWMCRWAVITVCIFVIASPGFATSNDGHPVSLDRSAAVYVVPSPSASRLAHLITKPPRLALQRYKVPLRVVNDARAAEYTVSCDAVKGGRHHKIIDIFAGEYLAMRVRAEVRDAKTNQLLAYRENQTGGGGLREGEKDKWAAEYCWRAIGDMFTR